MRRILLTLLIAVMVLSLASPALAADGDGRLTITKYRFDRLPGDIYGLNDGQQLAAGVLPADSYLLPGVEFTIVRVLPAADQSDPPTGAVFNPGSPGTWYVPVAASSQAKTTDSFGVADFTDLDYGVYYVVESPSPLVTDPAAPFFVAIPTIIDNNGTDLELERVWAYPKNEDLKITKTVIANNGDYAMKKGVAIGDTVTYRIVADIPTDIANATSYRIEDLFGAGLQFASIVSVKALATATLPEITGSTTLPVPAGQFSYSNTTPTTDGGTLVITVPKTTTSPDTDNFAKLAGYAKLEVLVNFTVTTNASLVSPIANHADLYYRNRYKTITDPETKRESEDPLIYTGGIAIFKHDSAITDLGLAGARFVLVPKTAANTPFDLTSFVEATDALKWANGTVVAATSNAAGVVVFKGIPFGAPGTAAYDNTPTEYWLVETTAPTGYRKPGGQPLVVTISHSSWVDPSTLAAPTDIATKVANIKGFNFPLTGGAGTMAFLVGGLALAGLSAGSWRLSRKEKKTA